MEFLDSFLIGFLSGAAPIILIAVIAWKKRCRKYDDLPFAGGIKVRYCPETRFRKWWKFFPWEGVGILTVEHDELTFEGFPNQGESFTVRVPRDALEFYGRRDWIRNGALPWLLLKNEPGDYYLALETGPFIFGVGKKTREAYASIREDS